MLMKMAYGSFISRMNGETSLLISKRIQKMTPAKSYWNPCEGVSKLLWNKTGNTFRLVFFDNRFCFDIYLCFSKTHFYSVRSFPSS